MANLLIPSEEFFFVGFNPQKNKTKQQQQFQPEKKL